MLHRDDGLCALQMELGENYLPNVCRLYPRNIKQLNENYEISCSNSCEAVVELLINMKRPLLFEEKDLSFHPEFVYNLPATKYEHCKKSISLLQERDLPLPERFLTLGSFLYGNDIFTNRPDHLGFAFQVLHILNRYYESNLSTGEYCTASQKYFCIGGNDKLSEDDLKLMTVKYTSAAMHLESILPDWQILFEQLFVNHMFYNKFPYTDHQENTTDAFLTLVITYAFLRINILGYMSDNSSQENLIDFLAAMFRLIEHSNFKFIASNLLKKGSDSIGECVLQLLYV
jgi:lysine-N-methylase